MERAGQHRERLLVYESPCVVRRASCLTGDFKGRLQRVQCELTRGEDRSSSIGQGEDDVECG